MNYETGTGQLLINVHEATDCQGPFCAIHRPCPGPWNDWPTHWRGDATILGLQIDIWRGFERICPCAVGHPAAEQVLQGTGPSTHGCCGICPCSPSACEEIYENGRFVGYRAKTS